MQNLIKLVKQFSSESPAPTPQELINRVREYLQILILKSIYRSKHGSALSFMGGTCLRICYDLKRYSEDLDFTLDKKTDGYSFSKMVATITKDLEATGFRIETTVNDEATVQKAFLRFSDLLQLFGFSNRKNQKLHIKLEVDTNAVKIHDDQRESFFVAKYNELFPILKHRKDTLFAGKILAILSRTYAKGRDYYDLIWYLREKVAIDMDYLQNGIAQTNERGVVPTPIPQFDSTQMLFDHLTEQISRIDTTVILRDVGKFLEDPSEEQWIRDYPKVFAQLISSYVH